MSIGAALTGGSESREKAMAAKGHVYRAVVASCMPLPQAAGAMHYWDGRNGMCCDVEPQAFLAPRPWSAFQAQGPPTTAPHTRPYWTTAQIGLSPAIDPQTIAWVQEAAGVTFDLDPVLLRETAQAGLASASGELVWVHGPEAPTSSTSAVHPVLRMHARDESLQADRLTIVPCLHAHDPLLHHMALVLQVTIESQSLAGHLYVTSLTDALAVHFLRRYAAARQSLRELTGRLSPYKLRRTTAYIKTHLEQELSLATLAAVAQTSPAHFARLFKHATGLTPHQYVITCRMAYAKQLLSETDMPLSEIGLQVGCADQSHFTALFRTHVSLTPKAYRDHTKPA